jgi:uncharacterized protein YxjI
VDISQIKELYVLQVKEIAEFFGFETRNKYQIKSSSGEDLLFAAETSKGFIETIKRLFLGHWRTFEIRFYKPDKQIYLTAIHPFRWIFRSFEIYDHNNNKMGSLEQRFAIFSKKFDVLDKNGKTILNVSSPLFKIWTFPFFHNGVEKARIEKKWSGLLKEAFTDADNFRIEFIRPDLEDDVKKILLASGIFIDLLYFEKKAGSN